MRQLPVHGSQAAALLQAIVSLLCTLASGSALACSQVAPPALPAAVACLCAGSRHRRCMQRCPSLPLYCHLSGLQQLPSLQQSDLPDHPAFCQ